MLFLHPIVFILSLYMATIYSYLYLCFTTFPRVFSGQYGFSEGSSGLVYLGSGVGSMLGLFICGALSDPLAQKLAAQNGGVKKPEYRLPIMALGGVLVPAGLFWYGWTAEYKEQYMLPVVGTGLFGCGMVIAFVRTLVPYLILDPLIDPLNLLLRWPARHI